MTYFKSRVILLFFLLILTDLIYCQGKDTLYITESDTFQSIPKTINEAYIAGHSLRINRAFVNQFEYTLDHDTFKINSKNSGLTYFYCILNQDVSYAYLNVISSPFMIKEIGLNQLKYNIDTFFLSNFKDSIKIKGPYYKCNVFDSSDSFLYKKSFNFRRIIISFNEQSLNPKDEFKLELVMENNKIIQVHLESSIDTLLNNEDKYTLNTLDLNITYLKNKIDKINNIK